LPERTHLQRATVARSLLLIALDDADADARNVVELLDGISGAHERTLLGRAQAHAGEAIPHSALREVRVGRSGR
jgi:hypothetical protein